MASTYSTFESNIFINEKQIFHFNFHHFYFDKVLRSAEYPSKLRSLKISNFYLILYSHFTTKSNEINN